MSAHRSKLEITLIVLSLVRDGVDKPTRIMYAANLSWNSVQSILCNLVRQGLLREVELIKGKRTLRRYNIVEKGLSVLRYFEEAPALIDVKGFSM